jgi:hypothetical protein
MGQLLCHRRLSGRRADRIAIRRNNPDSRETSRAHGGGNAAFATATIVYFSSALLLSALQRVPWPSISLAALLCGLTGLSGSIRGDRRTADANADHIPAGV